MNFGTTTRMKGRSFYITGACEGDDLHRRPSSPDSDSAVGGGQCHAGTISGCKAINLNNLIF